MAIEIIPKARIKIPTWTVFLLVFDVIIILGLGATYFYFYQTSKKMTQVIEEKKQALIDTPQEKALEANILLQEKRINTFSRVLSEHRQVKNIFTFLEEACHPEVEFGNFNFDSKDNSVTVSGKTVSFIVLGQQIMILKNKKELSKITLSGVSLSKEGDIIFSLQLTFNPQIFQ